jgi:hypothetical protein
MITAQTAMDIALAYREIETAEKLLAEIMVARARYQAPDIRDAFGRSQNGLQLGVPSGQNGHRLYNVPWEIVKPVIELHIAHHKARVAALSATAAVELARDTDGSPEGRDAQQLDGEAATAGAEGIAQGDGA